MEFWFIGLKNSKLEFLLKSFDQDGLTDRFPPVTQRDLDTIQFGHMMNWNSHEDAGITVHVELDELVCITMPASGPEPIQAVIDH